MKKFITLLLLALSAFTFRSAAQSGTTCNADFSFIISGFSVNFTPVITDSIGVHNYWSFGDGSTSSSLFTNHVFASPGTYEVKHYMYRPSTVVGAPPNCIDSVTKHVVIQSTNACSIHANYSYQRSSQNPNLIYFTNLSTPTNDIHYTKWSFGDGTYSNDFNTTHTYATSGVYNVCLTVRRSTSSNDCGDDTCINIQIQASSTACNIHTSFSYQRDSLQSNKVYFTNLSTPANDIHYTRWSFGDGTYSYDFNATHVYNASGTYNVCLTVRKQDSTCQRDTCMQIQVHLPPPPCTLVANFASYPDSNQVNKIHFINLSTPLSSTDSIRWTFGDGTTSYDFNPTHIYATPGTYTVCLRVKKNTTVAGATPCVKEICKQITVYSQCTLQAYFGWRLDSSNTSKVYFTNYSTPATAAATVQWTFGDGTSSSGVWSPDHIYAQGGTYNVCLRITAGVSCVKEFCKTIVVPEQIRCSDISKFNFTRSTVNCVEFKFEPEHKDSTWQYHWTFGDGTGSNSISPSHVYAHTGNYNVCLTVIKSPTCTSTTCKSVETGLCFTCSNVIVTYEDIRDANMPNKIYFHALSNYPILSQSWTFTKISPATAATVTLTQNNPTYIFPEVGYYRVCLRAVTYGGCVKEYCEVVYIGQLGGQCTLQSYPNPAHTQVSVNVQLTAPEMIHVYIYNSLNILVKQKDQQGSTGNNVITTNIESLVPGPYTIRVVYGNHICYSQFQKI